MSKNMLPLPTKGAGLLKKLIVGVVVIALLLLVVNHPTNAASAVTGVFHLAGRVIDAVTTFVQHL